MNLLSLIGKIIFAIGLTLLFVWLYEELVNNFNYYYYNQVNFILLIVFSVLALIIGTKLIYWEETKQNKIRAN